MRFCKHQICGFLSSRDVAQPGSALAWGARGREFKSRRPDHLKNQPFTRNPVQAGILRETALNLGGALWRSTIFP
jgi:hypothetical protein